MASKKRAQHSINSAHLPIPAKVKRDIEDCKGILLDVLSWLFEEDVRIESGEVTTGAKDIDIDHGEFEKLPLDVQERFMEDAVDERSKFKIVVELDRYKVLTKVMNKLSSEQQAELSGYLMRREQERHD